MNQLRLRCPVVQLFVPVTQPADITISRNKWSLMNTSDTQSSLVLMLNVDYSLNYFQISHGFCYVFQMAAGEVLLVAAVILVHGAHSR